MNYCDYCTLPIMFDEYEITYHETECFVHAECGREMQARLRDQIIRNVTTNDRLAREIRSFRIAATIDDGLTIRDDVCVAGWAY